MDSRPDRSVAVVTHSAQEYVRIADTLEQQGFSCLRVLDALQFLEDRKSIACLLIVDGIPQRSVIERVTSLHDDSIPFPVVLAAAKEEKMVSGFTLTILKYGCNNESILEAVRFCLNDSRAEIPAPAISGPEPPDFRKIFERIPIGVAVKDADGQVVECNRAYEQIVGYEGSELHDLKFMQLIHPEDRAGNADAVDRLRAGGAATIELRNRYIRKDGTTVWVKKLLSRVDGPTSKGTIIAFVTGIPPGKFESDSTIAVCEECGLGFWEYGKSSQLIELDGTLRSSFGGDQTGPLSFEDFLQNALVDDQVLLRSAFRDCLSGGEPIELEFSVPSDEGSRWIALRGSAVADSHGLCSGLRGIALDVTEQHQKAAKRLQGEHNRDLALRAAKTGWWHYDPSTNRAIWDETCGSIFGMFEDSASLGELLDQIHPDDVKDVWNDLNESLTLDHPVDFHRKFRVQLDDGAVRWVEAHGSCNHDGAGRTFSGTVRDISDQEPKPPAN